MPFDECLHNVCYHIQLQPIITMNFYIRNIYLVDEEKKKSKNLFHISFAYFFMVPSVRIQLSDFNVINVFMQEFANVYQDLKIIETIFYFRFSEKCSHNIIGHC